MSNDDDKYDDPRDEPADAVVRVGPGPLDFAPIRGTIETEDEDQETSGRMFSSGVYGGLTQADEAARRE